MVGVVVAVGVGVAVVVVVGVAVWVAAWVAVGVAVWVAVGVAVGVAVWVAAWVAVGVVIYMDALEQILKEKRKAAAERHHIKFRTMWKAIGGPAIGEECQFSPKRRWRFDFAHKPSMVAIEIEGGVWSGGRHTRGSGYVKDCEKYLEANLLGWAVLRLTPELITFPNLETIAAFMRNRATKMADPYEASR